MRGSEVFLHGISTAVPPHRISQERALDFMIENLRLCDKAIKLLERIYRRSAISYRHSVIPELGDSRQADRFFTDRSENELGPTTSVRNAIFAREAETLTHTAVSSLCKDLAIDPDSITHLVTASCTGFSAPGFDLSLVKSIPLRPSVSRFHLGFMGCFAAIPALRLADHICRSDPDAKVIVVNAELCTLHFQRGHEAETLVANSLFADGVSAALVAGDNGRTERPG